MNASGKESTKNKKKGRKVVKSDAVVKCADEGPVDQGDDAGNGQEKRGRKQNKSTKQSGDSPAYAMPSDTNEVTEVHSEANQAILGFARMCFADLCDLGYGPPLQVLQVNSREPTSASLNGFIRALGGDPMDPSVPYSKMARYIARNAMVVAIDPEWISLDHLETNPNAHKFPSAVFLDGAPKAINAAELLNGYHRYFVAKKLGAMRYAEYQRAKAAVNQLAQTSTSSPDFDGQMAILMERQSSIEKKLRELASWLVVFYDRKKISESKNSQAVLHYLARNSNDYQANDNEEIELRMALNFCRKNLPTGSLANLTPQDIKLDEWKWIASLRPSRRLISASTDKGLFCEIVKATPFIEKWTIPCIRPTNLHNWKTHVSPFMEAILCQGSAVLYFLSSDHTVPDTFSPSALRKLREEIRTRPAPPLPGVLDTEFFDTVTEAYKRHIYPERELFGIGRANELDTVKFSDAFAAYLDEVTDGVAFWVSSRIDQIRASTSPSAEAVRVLKTLAKRLRWVLVHGLFNSSLFGMEFSTPSPILCPLFIIDVSTALLSVKTHVWLMMQWLEPLLGSSFIYQRFDGSSGVLLAAISRWNPTEAPVVILRKFLALVFNHRTTTLVQMRAQDGNLALIPPPASTISQGTDDSEVDFCQLFHNLQEVLRSWRRSELVLLGPTAKIVPHVPDMDNIAPDMLEGIIKFNGAYLALTMLHCTALPWADVSSANTTGRMQQITGYVIQGLWQYVKRTLPYSKHSFFWDLRNAIESLAHEQLPGFDRFWDELEEDESLVIPASSPGDFTLRKKVSLKAKAAQIQVKTAEMCREIIALLCKKDVGAIPVPTGEYTSEYHPHHDVYHAAIQLFQKVAIASHRAQIMYTDPARDRSQEIGPDDFRVIYDSLNIPATFKHAPSKFTAHYYTSINTEALQKIESLGEGSLAAQIRQDNAVRRQFSKKRAVNLLAPLLPHIPPPIPLSMLQDPSLLELGSSQTIVEDEVHAAPEPTIFEEDPLPNATGSQDGGDDSGSTVDVDSNDDQLLKRKRVAEGEDVQEPEVTPPQPHTAPPTTPPPAPKKAKVSPDTPPCDGFDDETLSMIDLDGLEGAHTSTPKIRGGSVGIDSDSEVDASGEVSSRSSSPSSSPSAISSPVPSGARRLRNRRLFFRRK